MRKAVINFIFVIISPGLFSQYYPHYSQYLINGQTINPAFAGSRDVLSLSALYRDQWIGFDGAPKTMTFSGHTPLRKLSSAVGINVLSDRIGVSTHNSVFLNYAYRIRFKKNNRTLAFGLGAGVDMFRSDLSKITTASYGDRVFENQILKSTKLNFSTGIYYYAKRFFAGWSSPSLMNYGYDVFSTLPDSLKTLPSNYFFLIGYTFKLNNEIKLRLSLLRKNYPGYNDQIDFNTSLIVYDRLNMTLSFRDKESLIWITEYQINDQIRIGYAHDFVLSRMNKYSHGTNEFFIRYELIYKTDMANIRFF